jgi:hypothetical protein
MNLDPRVTPLRDGIAALSLEGLAAADVYLETATMGCVAPATAIRAAADPGAEQMDQLLFGETFRVLEEEGAFRFGQAGRDGYMGFVEAVALAPSRHAPSHRVAALRTYAFAEPSIKSRAMALYSLNSLVRVEAEHGRLA